MLQNNGARLNIWKELSNPFDYQTFVTKCSEQNIIPMSNVDFAQKAGMLMSAKALYPNLELEQAYIMFVQESMGVGSVGVQSGITNVRPNGNTVYVESNDVSKDLIAQLGNKSCCGGGQVR